MAIEVTLWEIIGFIGYVTESQASRSFSVYLQETC